MSSIAVTPALPADLVDWVRREALADLNNVTDNLAVYTRTDRLDEVDEVDQELDRLDVVVTRYRTIRHTEPDQWDADTVRYGLDLVLGDIRAHIANDSPSIEEAERLVDAARRVRALLAEVPA